MKKDFEGEPIILTIQEIGDKQLLKDFNKCKERLEKDKNDIISKIYYPSFIKELEKRGLKYEK